MELQDKIRNLNEKNEDTIDDLNTRIENQKRDIFNLGELNNNAKIQIDELE